MPPADSPVEATDNATDRRRTNHRATVVVAGTRPAKAKPTPKSTSAAKACQGSVAWPSRARPAAPSTTPTAMTRRTSIRSKNPETA